MKDTTTPILKNFKNRRYNLIEVKKNDIESGRNDFPIALENNIKYRSYEPLVHFVMGVILFLASSSLAITLPLMANILLLFTCSFFLLFIYTTINNIVINYRLKRRAKPSQISVLYLLDDFFKDSSKYSFWRQNIHKDSYAIEIDAFKEYLNEHGFIERNFDNPPNPS